jgi:hypothetical protein
VADKKPVRKRALGAWVIQADGKTIIENSEMRAYRSAVNLGGTVEFVEFGHAVGEFPDPSAPLKVPAKPVSTDSF